MHLPCQPSGISSVDVGHQPNNDIDHLLFLHSLVADTTKNKSIKVNHRNRTFPIIITKINGPFFDATLNDLAKAMNAIAICKYVVNTFFSAADNISIITAPNPVSISVGLFPVCKATDMKSNRKTPTVAVPTVDNGAQIWKSIYKLDAQELWLNV